MWRSIFENQFPDYDLLPPSSPEEVRAVEASLGVAFPEELKALHLETNGVSFSHKPTAFLEFENFLIWQLAEIVDGNTNFLEDEVRLGIYKPFDGLLFFGADLNGDQFFFRIEENGICEPMVFRWDHETDRREHVADSLKAFVEKHLPKYKK